MVGARQARWLLSSADHGWRAMNFGRGGRLFGRGSSNRRAKELSYAGIPLGAKLGLRNLAQKPSNQLGLEGSGLTMGQFGG